MKLLYYYYYCSEMQCWMWINHDYLSWSNMFLFPPQGLEEYCTLIDSSSSFRAYRAALAEVEPPCIPYLWVHENVHRLVFGCHSLTTLFCLAGVSFCRTWPLSTSGTQTTLTGRSTSPNAGSSSTFWTACGASSKCTSPFMLEEWMHII